MKPEKHEMNMIDAYSKGFRDAINTIFESFEELKEELHRFSDPVTLEKGFEKFKKSAQKKV